MSNNFFIFFISSTSIAGIAVIWRNWIADHPNWKRWIENELQSTGKSLLCGSCFTYWLALVFTLLVHPLLFWTPFQNTGVGFTANVFFQWMALSWLSVFLRFLYVALQELVHYQVHHTKDDHNHQ